MSTATAKVIPLDPLARKAQAALVTIEECDSILQSAEKAKPRIREAWRAYGAVLLEMRKKLSGQHNTKKFGAWVVANKLDTGAARKAPMRSDAMWLAEHWKEVQGLGSALSANTPDHIRQLCRDANYSWAFAGGKLPKKKRSAPGTKSTTYIVNKAAVGQCAIDPDHDVKVYIRWTESFTNVGADDPANLPRLVAYLKKGDPKDKANFIAAINRMDKFHAQVRSMLKK